MNKICVYTICYNEADHITQWLQSITAADFIYILDTGSTDNTIERIENYPLTNIKLEIIDNEQLWVPGTTLFNFGAAKDLALRQAQKYIGEDTEDINWIMIQLDADEYLDSASFNQLRVNWTSEYDTAFCYRMGYQQNQNKLNGEWMPHKIHSNKNWHWNDFIVHETLTLDGRRATNSGYYFNILQTSITIYHEDRGGGKDKYLPHLFKQIELTPDEPQPYIWLLLSLGPYQWIIDKLKEATDKCKNITKGRKQQIQKMIQEYTIGDKNE